MSIAEISITVSPTGRTIYSAGSLSDPHLWRAALAASRQSNFRRPMWTAAPAELDARLRYIRRRAAAPVTGFQLAADSVRAQFRPTTAISVYPDLRQGRRWAGAAQWALILYNWWLVNRTEPAGSRAAPVPLRKAIGHHRKRRAAP